MYRFWLFKILYHKMLYSFFLFLLLLVFLAREFAKNENSFFLLLNTHKDILKSW